MRATRESISSLCLPDPEQHPVNFGSILAFQRAIMMACLCCIVTEAARLIAVIRRFPVNLAEMSCNSLHHVWQGVQRLNLVYFETVNIARLAIVKDCWMKVSIDDADGAKPK